MSKILSAQQLREADQYTIQHEPIESIDLMERAATNCFRHICALFPQQKHFTIFCGIGNNGGDGLVIARLMKKAGIDVNVHIIQFSPNCTEDFLTNLNRLRDLGIKPTEHRHQIDFEWYTQTVIIDALLGTGVTRKLQGILADVASKINRSGFPVVAIDLPSGLYDSSNTDDNRAVAIHATHTLTFQSLKYCFLLPENHKNIGNWEVLDIGLNQSFIDQLSSKYEAVDLDYVRSILKDRNPHSHKGTHGHALLCVGSKSMMGAAVMSSKSCLRSGVGLLTVLVPNCGYEIMQASVPEAMALTSGDEDSLAPKNISFTPSAIGIGPGIGKNDSCKSLLQQLIDRQGPMVIDADALNLLSTDLNLLQSVPKHSILTPHPKEFDRLFGNHNSSHERIQTAINKAKELTIVIILKGHHTSSVTSEKVFFNLSGNAGMATGGAGDVLTGIITGLLAQGYSSENAATLGVYLHGLAGDIAVRDCGQEALIASDIIENIGHAFQQIHQE